MFNYIEKLKNYFFCAVFSLELIMPQKRKGISKRIKKPFLIEYNFEIKVIFLLALGIFLLVENLEIKQFIYLVIRELIFSIGHGVKWMRDFVLLLIAKIEISDLVGISIILYVLYLIGDRWRERMINRFSNLKYCPKCQGDLQRIKRSFKHRLMSNLYFVNIKNYKCKICNYDGIKLVK